MGAHTIVGHGSCSTGTAASLLLLLLAAGCPPAQQVIPAQPLDAGIGDSGPVDPVVEALHVIDESARVAPQTQEQADAWFGRKLAARATLEANQVEAQTILLEELGEVTLETPDQLAQLTPAIELIGDAPAVLEMLHGLAMAPLTPAEETSPRDEREPAAERTRNIGMELLAHHARHGSAEARAQIMSAAASPSLSVRSSAVQVTLATSHNRRQAQRQLAELLPAESRHLLYQF